MSTVYQKTKEKTTEATKDYLEEFGVFPGRDWHERNEKFRGYRNG